MSDYGHLRYVSNYGIAPVGLWSVSTGIENSIIPALMADVAPDPHKVFILAGDICNLWNMHPEEFLIQTKRLEELFPTMCLEEVLGYLAQVPQENILWREEEDIRAKRVACTIVRNRHRLYAQYSFLCEVSPLTDEPFRRYLNRLGQFVDLLLDPRNKEEPNLTGRHSGVFIPMDFRLVWGTVNISWALAYPCHIDRMRILLEDLPEPIVEVAREIGSGNPLIPLFNKTELDPVPPEITRVELLVE